MMAPAKMKFNPPKKFTLLVQIRLRSRREDEFLANYLLIYILFHERLPLNTIQRRYKVYFRIFFLYMSIAN
jgi:hypothetical protein